MAKVTRQPETVQVHTTQLSLKKMEVGMDLTNFPSLKGLENESVQNLQFDYVRAARTDLLSTSGCALEIRTR